MNQPGLGPTKAHLDPAIISQVATELDTGEHVLWAGRPDPLVYARFKGGRLAVWGVPFLMFAVFWTYFAVFEARVAEQPGAVGVLFPLFGLLFVGAGLYQISTPVRLWWQARSLLYAVTDRRVLILRRFPSRTVYSLAPHSMTHVEKHGGAEGSGTLVLRREPKVTSTRISYDEVEGLFGIPDVNIVERLVQRLLSGGAAQAGERRNQGPHDTSENWSEKL